MYIRQKYAMLGFTGGIMLFLSAWMFGVVLREGVELWEVPILLFFGYMYLLSVRTFFFIWRGERQFISGNQLNPVQMIKDIFKREVRM